MGTGGRRQSGEQNFSRVKLKWAYLQLSLESSHRLQTAQKLSIYTLSKKTVSAVETEDTTVYIGDVTRIRRPIVKYQKSFFSKTSSDRTVPFVLTGQNSAQRFK